MSAAAVVLLVLLAAALAGAGVAAFFAVASYRRSQLLGVPSADIADLRPGFGKVRGAVAARGKLLSGPLSGRPCVYYRFRVEEERRKVYRKARPGEDTVTTNVFGAAHGRVIDG